MQLHFASKTLAKLYTEGKAKYPAQVVEAFFEVLEMLESATDERDLYVLKNLRYEKLVGDRQGQHSVVLWHGYRLCFTIEQDEQGRYLSFLEIVDYHKKGKRDERETHSGASNSPRPYPRARAGGARMDRRKTWRRS